MSTLTTLQQITPPHITNPNQRSLINQPLHHHIRRETPRTWRLRGGPKGFAGAPKDTAGKRNKAVYTEKKKSDEEEDDKIPDAVWNRMIPRILSFVGVPLAIGFAFLKGFDLAIEQGAWNVPKWVPFLTTFVTFGASALGIAIGSLSTSLDEDEAGSFLGFEQMEKNWGEMWKEEE